MKTTLAVLSIALLTAATPPSIDTIRQWQQRSGRIRAIGDRLLTANLETCIAKRNDFGMVTVSLNPDASPKVRTTWVQALQLKEGSNVTYLSAAGPAQLAGINIGDVVLAVGETRWSEDAASQKALSDAIRHAEIEGSGTFTIQHGSESKIIALQARRICDAYVTLAIDRGGSNAWASGKTLFIEGGLEKLLPDDAELAFVMAHEAAHVFLGHSGDKSTEARGNEPKRQQMEIEADKLAVRLMARAGYDPDAAARAHPKIDRANRGRLAGLLGIRGPYLSVKDRSNLLAAQSYEVKRSMAAEANSHGLDTDVSRAGRKP